MDHQPYLDQLQASISRFYAARARTNRFLEQHPEAAEVVAAGRDAPTEVRAAQELRELGRMLLGREPTREEMSRGVVTAEPDQLGLLPLVAIAGGAWGLSSVFGYLEEREQRLQRELGMTSSWSDAFGAAAPYISPLLLIGGVGFGGYFAYKHFTKDTRRPPKRKISGRTGRPAASPRKRPSEE